MADTSDKSTGQRDRSPAYPSLPLEQALTRLAEFDAHFKRSPAPSEKVGNAWGIKGKAYADRMAAALRYFGLLEYQGSGKTRHIVISDDGRKYLRAQQDDVKREVARAAALRPRAIAKFWGQWGPDRPADAACLDELVLKNGFSEVGAREFLRVYDATITFAGLSESDKVGGAESAVDRDEDGDDQFNDPDPPLPPPPGGSRKGRQVTMMAGERELTTGLLSKEASFRLIVSGAIGVKEIERLIKKLELDKEILAEPDAASGDELG